MGSFLLKQEVGEHLEVIKVHPIISNKKLNLEKDTLAQNL